MTFIYLFTEPERLTRLIKVLVPVRLIVGCEVLMSRSTRVVVVVEDRWAEVSSGQGRRLEMPEMRG